MGEGWKDGINFLHRDSVKNCFLDYTIKRTRDGRCRDQRTLHVSWGKNLIDADLLFEFEKCKKKISLNEILPHHEIKIRVPCNVRVWNRIFFWQKSNDLALVNTLWKISISSFDSTRSRSWLSLAVFNPKISFRRLHSVDISFQWRRWRQGEHCLR